MITLADYIIRKNVPLNENPTLPVFRGKVGMVQGWISIILNLLLFGIKLFFGVVSNSIALIADAFHTLSDMASSAIVVFGFKMASKPADKEHPFGHGRAETIAALCIAILIGFAGFEFLKTSIVRLMYIEIIQVSQIILAVVFITIILKEAMARLSYSLGETINSDTLKADAIHHRTDMFSSILVLVAIAGAWLGYPKLDAMMDNDLNAILSGVAIAAEIKRPLIEGKGPLSFFLKACEALETTDWAKLELIAERLRVESKTLVLYYQQAQAWAREIGRQ